MAFKIIDMNDWFDSKHAHTSFERRGRNWEQRHDLSEFGGSSGEEEIEFESDEFGSRRNETYSNEE